MPSLNHNSNTNNIRVVIHNDKKKKTRRRKKTTTKHPHKIPQGYNQYNIMPTMSVIPPQYPQIPAMIPPQPPQLPPDYNRVALNYNNRNANVNNINELYSQIDDEPSQRTNSLHSQAFGDISFNSTADDNMSNLTDNNTYQSGSVHYSHAYDNHSNVSPMINPIENDHKSHSTKSYKHSQANGYIENEMDRELSLLRKEYLDELFSHQSNDASTATSMKVFESQQPSVQPEQPIETQEVTVKPIIQKMTKQEAVAKARESRLNKIKETDLDGYKQRKESRDVQAQIMALKKEINELEQEDARTDKQDLGLIRKLNEKQNQLIKLQSQYRYGNQPEQLSQDHINLKTILQARDPKISLSKEELKQFNKIYETSKNKHFAKLTTKKALEYLESPTIPKVINRAGNAKRPAIPEPVQNTNPAKIHTLADLQHNNKNDNKMQSATEYHSPNILETNN